MEILLLILIVGGILLGRYLYIKKIFQEIFLNRREITRLRTENVYLKSKVKEFTVTIQNQNNFINEELSIKNSNKQVNNSNIVFSTASYRGYSLTSPYPTSYLGTQYEEIK